MRSSYECDIFPVGDPLQHGQELLVLRRKYLAQYRQSCVMTMRTFIVAPDTQKVNMTLYNVLGTYRAGPQPRTASTTPIGDSDLDDVQPPS